MNRITGKQSFNGALITADIKPGRLLRFLSLSKTGLSLSKTPHRITFCSRVEKSETRMRKKV
ncbi:hypothetical protein HanIR_Chr12g0576381 [Helianthus annuus]|nr:hypothetical protein HanIR_Chr12g0576381 [Helianthus annuus]